MARAITFDGTSLQTANISIREIDHESLSNIRFNYQKITGRDGATFVNDDYDPRVIKMRGAISGSSAADLDERIDNLKELLNRRNKQLRVEYRNGTRMYIANLSNNPFPRDYYHITWLPFELEFIVANPPWGKAIDSTTSSWAPMSGSAAVTSTIEDVSFGVGKAVYFGGTRRPLPKLMFKINTCSSLSRIKFTNTSNNDAIGITRTFSAGETIVIDCDNLTVQVDGVDVDYDGIFPEFELGWNNFKVAFVARAYNIDFYILYYLLWL